MIKDMKDLKRQGFKAWKYLNDIDKDDVLDYFGLEQRTSPWVSALGTIGIFALGCLVGAGIGLAFAPKSGEEFRNQVGERMKKKADELGEVAKDYASRAQMPVT
jgi:hypothetical protein